MNGERKYLHYTGYGLLLLLLHCLQFSPGGGLRLFGAYPNGVLLLVVFVAMAEGNFGGSMFGMAAGMLTDINSVNGSGMHALFYLIIGFFCGFLAEYLMQHNFLTALLLSVVSVLIMSVLEWLFKASSPDFSLYLSYYLKNAAYTCLLAAPLYPVFCLTTGNRRKRICFSGLYGPQTSHSKGQ